MMEGIFEQLKKFLSPQGIWQKILVPQYDLLNSIVLVPLTQSSK